MKGLPLLFLVAALVLGGCGSGSSTSSTTSAPAEPSGAETVQPASGKPRAAEGSDNSIQEFGSEAARADFERAAESLHAYFDARAAGKWGKVCSQLALVVKTQLAELPRAKKSASCPQLLASFAAPLRASARKTEIADVGAFRVAGDRGLLLFHGVRGGDYFMPMARDGRAWKVAAIAASPLR